MRHNQSSQAAGNEVTSGGRTISTKIFHFGPPECPLLGALHQSPRLRRRTTAVLLCNPFGEEATRAHRLYRVMASQLELAGHTVLRFDFRGTGDSGGGEEHANIGTWLEDTELAAGELQRAAGAPQLILVGLRMGATLASLASARGQLRPRHLVLWDPIVEGPAFVRELASAHRQFMTEEMADVGWHDTLRVDTNGVPDESLGTTITSRLAAELLEIDIASTPPAADHITVICTCETPAMARLRASIGSLPTTRWLDIRASADWNTDSALNNATVPLDIVQAVVARIQEVNP
jgi:uncharacterized protein